VTLEWIFLKQQKRNIETIEQKLNPENLLIVLTGSLGDVYVSIMLMETLSEFNKKNVTCVIEPHYKRLAERFASQKVDFVFIEDTVALRQRIDIDRNFPIAPGKFFPSLLTLVPYIAEANITGRCPDFIECYRLILGLPRAAPLCFGRIADERKREAIEIAAATGKRLGKTVVVCPITNSYDSLTSIQLEVLVSSIKEAGLDYVINASSNLKKPSFEMPNDASVLRLEPDLLFEVSEAFGYMLSVASGLAYLSSVIPHKCVVAMIRDEKPINLNVPQLDLGRESIKDSAKTDLVPENLVNEFYIKNREISTLRALMDEVIEWFESCSSDRINERA
jgi:hypothetical protein